MHRAFVTDGVPGVDEAHRFMIPRRYLATEEVRSCVSSRTLIQTRYRILSVTICQTYCPPYTSFPFVFR